MLRDGGRSLSTCHGFIATGRGSSRSCACKLLQSLRARRQAWLLRAAHPGHSLRVIGRRIRDGRASSADETDVDTGRRWAGDEQETDLQQHTLSRVPLVTREAGLDAAVVVATCHYWLSWRLSALMDMQPASRPAGGAGFKTCSQLARRPCC
jgi:hypothetical protein